MGVAPEDADRLAGILRDAGSVVVGAHVDPDGDAVGSTLGLCIALQRLGIAAVPVLAGQDHAPETYSFLPHSADYRRAGELETPDVFIALDTPSFARLGDAEALARGAAELVVIDHHPDNARFGTLCLLDAKASSVGAMLWELLPSLSITPTPELATCLYTALVTDTGRFSYSNTSPAAFRIAAEMVAAGVDVAQVFSAVYENRSAGALALIGRTLERVTPVDDGRIAFSWIDDDDYAQTGALKAEGENLIDEVRTLGGAQVVFLMKHTDGQVRVSLRAKAGADVGSVARSFGGGGHTAAAGFTFEGSPDELLDGLLQALRETLA